MPIKEAVITTNGEVLREVRWGHPDAEPLARSLHTFVEALHKLLPDSQRLKLHAAFKTKDGIPVMPPIQPNHAVEVDINIRLRCQRVDADHAAGADSFSHQ